MQALLFTHPFVFQTMVMNMRAHGFEIREMEMAPQNTRRATCMLVSEHEGIRYHIGGLALNTDR